MTPISVFASILITFVWFFVTASMLIGAIWLTEKFRDWARRTFNL